MTDVATLGLSVDSSQVATATAALNQLAAAAKPASDATASLQTSAGAVSESLRGQRLVLAGLTSDLALFGGGLGQAAAVASTLYIENAHLAEGWSGLKDAIGGLFTPTNLLIGATAALVVGGYEAVTSVMAQEKALEDLANQSGLTLTELHGLSDAASFKGIDTADLTKGLTAFGTASYQAVNNMGTLGELLRANGIAAGTTEQNFMSIANLIKNATSSQQQYALLQEAGLPATAQWVALLSQGAQGIKTAAGNAGSFANGEETQLIAKARELGEAFNTSWKNATDSGNNFVLRMLAGFDDMMNSPVWKFMQTALTFGSMAIGGRVQTQTPAQQVSSGFNSLNNNYSNPALQTGLNKVAGIPTPQDLATLKNNIQLQQQLTGLLGPLASVDQLVAQKENEINLARLSGVTITKSQEAAMLAYAQASALGITQINTQTDALTVEAQTFGMTTGAAAAFTAVQTKINENIRLGHPLSQQQIADLQANAAALGDASEKMDEMRTAQSALSSAFQTFRTDMENGTSAWTALKDAAVTALNSISDKLMDMAAKNLVAAAFGSSSSSGGGILGIFQGLLGGGASAVASGGKAATVGLHSGGVIGSDATFTRNVDPAHFAGAPRFHDGGIAGDEVPVIAKAGEGVFTPAQMKALAPAGASSQAPVNVTVNQNNDFRGTDPSSIARINAALVQTKNQAVSEAISGILKLQKNAPGVARPQ